MYLYVEFADTWGAWHDQSMGFSAASRKRIKKIKLTEEQIKELEPRHIGDSGGKKIYESVNILSIQED